MIMEQEDAVIFCRKDLPNVSFAALDDMRQKHELCDVMLEVQNCTLAAHRVILAAGIPYFRTLFTTAALENGCTVAMDDIDPTALESLILYAYTSQVKISMANARSLLLTSETLQLSEVKSACIEFLSERLTVHNVVSVRTLALTFNDSRLLENCDKYIQNNFEEFCKSDNFLNLPYPDVLQIIANDKLNVSAEETVYEAVMNWVKFSLEKRQDTLHKLLSEICMLDLSISYLVTKVSTEKLIRSSIPCMELVQDVQSYHLSPKDASEILNFNVHSRTRAGSGLYHRHKESETEIYVVCFLSKTFLVYDWNLMKNASCKLISKEMQASRIDGAVAVNDCIYIFLEETVEKFYTKTLSWEVLPTKHAYISGATFVPQENLIYCFGSVNGAFQGKVRLLDTNQDKWQMEKNMKTPRFESAAVVLDDYIFVTGGFRISLGYTDIVEKYHPSTNHWTEMASMLTPRCGHSCAVINKNIYVCGGLICSEVTATAEAYDSVVNKWYHIACMSTMRSFASLVSYGGKLYALGGETETGEDTCEVEIFEPEKNRWSSGFAVPEGFWTCCINTCGR